ncbi:RagB/SusD family nutrient uptake outer membrane protein [Segetibacter sp. 3557_3]|uniref:RagB/SusD family nutrient uptake outer membrane protein n=1 Tax=Segetibacter sp. 3557_3 TaxID=2547429 RepID=UPI001058A379|nr:RagB/SusD family nutrient uptake outer membrane protein [Segetibacter sp. 3557_3]TDH23465.1 RagB/SusD family nutrient uptake outer membrane protein [Segetibacter sp. 3557_3]
MGKNLLVLLIVALAFGGCRKNLVPLDDNHRTLEDIYADAGYAEGILMNAYTRLPTNTYTFTEVATDDAVTNNKFSPLLNMALGSWSAASNPVDQWNNSYTAIMYLNLFLREVDSVNWAPMSNKDVRRLFSDRLKGEVYGLRALFMFHLLQSHAGYSTSGELLGVPIITEALEPGSDFKRPRNTFDQCMQQIYADLAESEKYLPLDYLFQDITNPSQLPAKYAGVATGDYNRVFGRFARQRMSGRIVKAIRAKAALLAASPAFNPQSLQSKWEAAANFAGEVLTLNGGVNGMDPQGGLFYTSTNINALNLNPSSGSPVEQREMLWRGNIVNTSNLEVDNYPPTLFGNGRVNPTQNLVDAFPMANGYPITNPASGYVATNPYNNRDPRLRNYIVVNGTTMRSTTIFTKSDNPTNDAVDVLPTSTRTGYYMRKLLNESVNANPTSISNQRHYPVHIRYTEIYLIYAEAANEAWGPTGTGTHGFSARDVIAAIRRRATITQPDNYLATIGTKEEMRSLIRNERRLELSFEGFRFWDLRRWKENLNDPARGVLINNNVYNIRTVESRQYTNDMYYGPIPLTEALKANLQQNKGW